VTEPGPAGRATPRDRRLEAPHRRPEPPTRRPKRHATRILERTAVVGYRATAAILAHVPPRLSRATIGTAAQASYLAWPSKRRFVNANFGHVLGLPPDRPEVRSLALRAYREYARYIVELMRLPSRPAEELAEALDAAAVDTLVEVWRGSGGPLIVVAGHVGNNEAVAAGLAERGYPVSVIADDTSFPELFALLRRQREAWGVHLVPWRNLRAMFAVLRRKEILALLVDWGYRDDGIPVRLFDAWTTLPAGPATLAAKSGATIAPLAIRRTPEGRFRLEVHDPIRVASTDPAELQRATQAMADELEVMVGLAPEQWYSFKPLWPASPDAAADLERRARIMQAGQPDPGPASRRRDAAELAVEGA
jgi:phosphatidylinositol dimannoside acyltransferase